MDTYILQDLEFSISLKMTVVMNITQYS